MTTNEKINQLMRDLVGAVEEAASQCKTPEDLQEAAKLGRWLMAVANRNLGMALIAYINDGNIPQPLRGNYAARATDFLQSEGLDDPDLTDHLNHVLQLQRATQFAYKHVITPGDAS
jgi:hypothetical protein